jgi:dipeptidyl aminopeptidase/acylaminoacyl peptidase
MVSRKCRFLSLIVLVFFCEIIHIDAMLEIPNSIIEIKPEESQNKQITPIILDQPLTKTLPAKAGEKIITPDWLLTLPNDTDNYPKINWLNNDQIVYATPPNMHKKIWSIEIRDVNTNEHHLLGEGALPLPSPDGQLIAFIKGEKTAKQLYLMDAKGNNIKQLSHIENGLGDYFSEFCWSPDSNQIALVHKPFIEYWSKEPQPKTSINIIDIKSGQMNQIASFEESIDYLSYFPNGDELLFMKMRIGSLYKEDEDHEWIQSLNIKNGHLRTLAMFDGLQQFLSPICAPNGEKIAFTYDADNPEYNFMLSIGLVSNDPKNSNTLPSVNRLTYELKLFSPRWSNDSQHIYVRRDYGAYRQIYIIDTKTGKPTQITNAPLNVRNYDLSPDGLRLAWVGQDAQGTFILRVASNDGHNVKDLINIPAIPNDMALSEVREIDWQAPNYPARMRGLLVMPLNYQKDTSYPLIVDIHGGGAGAQIYLDGNILLNTPLEWHMWAAKGYAVFVPEFRSSASFGSLAITRDEFQNHDLVNCDIKDIEAGIDSLIAAGIVDKNRLAAIGHSAGARRANWLVASTHRFRAVVSKEGWADEWIEIYNQTPSKRINKMFGGAPWEVPQNYFKNSALFHAKGATTPTLFLMGNPEKGGLDTSNSVNKFYNALKAQGIETAYVKYNDEGHVFEQPANRRDALERSIRWIDDHMGKR